MGNKYDTKGILSLKNCMSFCLRDDNINYTCSSIIKSIRSYVCNFVDKRSDHPEVILELSTDHQYFDLPLWYSGNNFAISLGYNNAVFNFP